VTPLDSFHVQIPIACRRYADQIRSVRSDNSAPLASTLALGLVVGLAKILITAPFMHRYGWDRDELYFLAAARHPALGYVDFPPVTAWIGWLVVHTVGASLFWLRMTSQIASLIGVVIAAVMARDLGGGLRTQTAAAIAWATTPAALAAGSLYHPTLYDATAWIAISWVALRIVLGGGAMRWWVALGILAGLGIETKYTVAVFLVSLIAALALAPGRRLLLSPGPLVAAGLAVLLTIPNLVWEQQHNWASVRFYPSQQTKTAGDTSHLAYIGQGTVFLGAMGVLVVVGLVWLWRRPEVRPLAIAAVLVTVIFFVERGRSYYPLPALVLPLTAGVVSCSRWLEAGSRLRIAAVGALAVAHVAVLALVVPLVVGVLPTATMIHDGYWKASWFKDEIGWPEMVDQVTQAWAQVPAADHRDAVLLASNYGEAGALAELGAHHGLPPVVSGHLSWQYWTPHPFDQTVALTVGYDRGSAGPLCTDWHPIAKLHNRWHIDNEEEGAWIGWCRLREPIDRLWPHIARDVL